jgi:hypothetical protein
MRLKKYLELIKESKSIDGSILQKLQIYLTDSIGSSVRSLGLTATDMQQICTDLDIETVEEFLEFYPFPNQRIRGYVEEFFSGKGEELFYGQDEEDYYSFDDDDDDDDEEYVEEDEEDLSGVAALAHRMLEESGLENFYVSNKGNNISIQFVLNKKEKFSKLTKILGLIKKLGSDILIQYDSEMDLWETKREDPLLTFDFYYNKDTKGKFKEDLPF